MKILAIRGSNLASLEGEFFVDFTAPPLADAGLFAISGPTGAGKSTLLDALCLALYHDTPRLAVVSEKSLSVPDVEQETLTPQDARTLLRRGAAEGYAEVDFVGVDGRRWRARWAVQRARRKARGRLQSATASLEDLDSGQPVATQVREVRDGIERRLGLSFAQFQRSVLLAQNDFAALLKARTSERAELLEALTDTAIFTRLSVLAHQRRREENEAVAALRAELQYIDVLNEVQRAVLEEEFAKASAAATATAAALQAVALEDNWHKERQRTLTRLSEGQAVAGRLAAELEARRQAFAELDMHLALRPLVSDHGRLAKLAQSISAQKEEVKQLTGALPARRQLAGQAKASALAAEQAFAAATKSYEEAKPALTKARELDKTLAVLQAHSIQWRQLQERLATGSKTQADAEAKLGVARVQAQQAAAHLVLSEKKRDDSRIALDHAKLAADAVTERLRAALIPGKPCMVCGATEHPGTAHAAIPDALLAELNRADKAAEQALKDAQNREKNSAVELRSAEKTLEAARQNLAQTRRDLEEARMRTKVDEIETAIRQTRDERRVILAAENVDAQAALFESAVNTALKARDTKQIQVKKADDDLQKLENQLAALSQKIEADNATLVGERTTLAEKLETLRPLLAAATPTLETLGGRLAALPADLDKRVKARDSLRNQWRDAEAARQAHQATLAELDAQAASKRDADSVAAALIAAQKASTTALETQIRLRESVKQDDERRGQSARHQAAIEQREQAARRWRVLAELIGSADGAKFRGYAQQFTLDVLLDYANQHLDRLAPRYQLRRGHENLSLLVVDRDFAEEARSVHSLSGGESFLVSLALALGLASLSSEKVKVESLFIDEGFGSLDADTLNVAMEALDRLQADGRRVGVISHVHDMAERIGVQVRVEPSGGGRSRIRVVG